MPLPLLSTPSPIILTLNHLSFRSLPPHFHLRRLPPFVWHISQSSPEKQNQYNMYGRSFVMRDWLLCLWRLRSLSIGHLQGGDPGKLVMSLYSESKGLRTRYKSQSKDRRPASCLSRQVEVKGATSAFLHPFVPLRLSRGWMMPAHTGSLLRCSVSPVSVSSTATRTDTPRNNDALGHPLAQSSCHTKLTTSLE